MKLEVGKYYKSRDGEVVKIVKYEEAEDFYRCRYRTYTPHGSYYTTGESDYDLIEEVVPVVAYRVKTEQTDMRDFIRSMEGDKGKVYTEFKLLPDGHVKLVRLGNYTYYATQVDAGYIDPITGEFVMNEKGSKKLKLEVGKTYRDGKGEIHKIISNECNPTYPEHIYRAENRSYTVEGFWQMEKKAHKYNLIEEVETKTTKKEQPKMKYYRTTVKNTETDFPIGTIVTLYNDDGTDQPQYKDVNTGDTNYLVTDRLEEINVKTVKTVISPASKLVKILEDSGYEVERDGNWRHLDKETFAYEMFYYCGENPSSNYYTWLPEWLEEKVVFDSVINTFNARQFIVDFMKKKRELSHEAYLYQRDIDEIENEWSDAECEKVAGKILTGMELCYNPTSCPFCIRYGFCNKSCTYALRHGKCGEENSDYSVYVIPKIKSINMSALDDFVNNYPGARK